MRVHACRSMVAVFGLVVGVSLANAQPLDGAGAGKLAGIDSGLAVHVGTTDGHFETELAAGGGLLVKGLANDVADVQRARQTIRNQGRYGLASVDHVASLKRLPYADHLANLVVADLDRLGEDAPDVAEIHRVLAPHGVALLKRDGKWTRHTQPVPDDVDTWGHWDHGADGNPFSRDQRVAPTTQLRWLAGTTSADGGGSKVGLRINDGNVYYTGVRYHVESRFRRNLPDDLFARDAFNGILRWKRAIDGVPGGGDQPPRFALTAHDGRVYVYPDNGGRLHALEAETGETLVVFKDGPVQPDITDYNKHRDPPQKVHFVVRVFDGKVLQTYGNTAYVSDASTGKLMWKREFDDVTAIGWAIAADGIVYLAMSKRDLVKNRASHATPTDLIIALDADTGNQVWRHAELAGRFMFRMIHYRDSILTTTFSLDKFQAYRGKDPLVLRLDAKTGRVVWSNAPEKAGTAGHYSIVMARGDEVIAGQQRGFGVDFNTGKLIDKYTWGQHDNSCADLKCVPGFTMYGLTFIDEAGNRIHRGQTRTICDVGLFPAYGMLYGSPLGCLCSEYINGYSALSAKPLAEPIADDRRLVRGPAFDELKGSQWSLPRKGAWPIHMADPRRSCATSEPVKAVEPATIWKRRLAEWPAGAVATDWQDNENIVGLVTAPTVAAGKIFVAAPDAHRLDCLDAATGEPLWSFTAAARIDSPPTILNSQGESICLFGSRDGYVYCLNADDGELVWRFLAARNDRRICVSSQIESAWPVFGSVMPDGDGVVVMAGRQSAIDGGIAVYKLAPRDGRVIWQTRAWNDPDAISRLDDSDLIRSRTRNQRVSDILVHNGERVCLWITPLEKEYDDGDLVDIETSVISARALRHSVPSKDELREVAEATWIWSASSAGLLSRRVESVGRHDGDGVNYADLNATKICLAQPTGDGQPTALFALQATGGQSKQLRGGLIRAQLNADGSLPARPEWSAKFPGNAENNAMIVAGERVYVTRYRANEDASMLHVYAAKDGAALGEFPLPGRVVRDGLIAAAGRLYAACADGAVYCLGEE